ncbi:MAG: enterotoxin [Pirellulales bacterium]|nr:enterotoxin [Pirellulales bacterium]
MNTRSPLARFAVAAVLTMLSALAGARVDALEFPGPDPGKARAEADIASWTLENEAIAFSWQSKDGSFKPLMLANKLAGATIDLGSAECFQVVLANTPLPGTRTVKASELKLAGKPEIGDVQANPQAARLADRSAGKQITAAFDSPDGKLAVQWKAVLRDGANYLRQEIVVRGKGGPLEVQEIVVWELAAPEAAVVGSVEGSPVVAGQTFFACDHPMSASQLLDPDSAAGPKRFRSSYMAASGLEQGKPLAASSVVGVVPAGQLRRGFLYYLERERAQPYRQLLHYNNGSEIGCGYWRLMTAKKPDEAQAFRLKQEELWLQLIEEFGRELVEKRGVKMDAFAHDFMWDDPALVWQFHQGHPNGFAPACETAARYGARLGVWFSPFGGYPCKPARLENGTKMGFEISRMGLTLAGPRYYARFAGACTGMVRDYGMAYFKFDGFGAGNNRSGAEAYRSDVEGLLRVIEELRRLDPTVFVNPSTGSWPSPFWLRYADSIWRQNADTHNTGKGSDRQKWITYRDGSVRNWTLGRGPLYPISSLMIHGVFINLLPLAGNPYDPKNPPGSIDPKDVTDEIRSFFATGVNLQELYITPERMTPEFWDVLAEAARWSRGHADVFADTHWVGGDPDQGEVYGWASWSKAKAVLGLRNPDDKPAGITLDIGKALELPDGAPRKYTLKSPWKEDVGKPAIELSAGEEHRFELEPFGVLVFDATPLEK